MIRLNELTEETEDEFDESHELHAMLLLPAMELDSIIDVEL